MALFSATFGALASWATIGVATAMVGTSVAASTGAFTPKAKIPEMPQMPETIKESLKETAAETIAKETTQAKEVTRQKQVATRRSRSIFTSPLGLAGEASTIKKTLLGE